MRPQRNATPRVFVGTQEIAGMMHGISYCLRQQGFQADLYLFDDHPFQYGFETLPNPRFRAWRQLKDFFKVVSSTSYQTKKWAKGFVALVRTLIHEYDIFIFNGWRTLLPNYADLPYIKSCGKKIITFFLGSETRPQWMQAHSFGKSEQEILACTQTVYNRVKIFEQYSDCIISHPPSSQFHTKPFLPLLGLGIPFARNIDISSTVWPERPLIIHAPSSPWKGTVRIAEAIYQLRTEGYDFEYRCLENVPNAEVLEQLAKCSFVVDELYSDSLLAGLGTEAAHFGKPTVVGSLPSPKDIMLGAEGIPLPPCEVFHDGNPLPAIRRLLDDKAYAHRLGQQAQEFVKCYWSDAKFGERLARIITGDIAYGAWCHPQDIRYFRGWGLSDQQFYTLVTRFISTIGHEYLGISDKPALLLGLLRWLKHQ